MYTYVRRHFVTALNRRKATPKLSPNNSAIHVSFQLHATGGTFASVTSVNSSLGIVRWIDKIYVHMHCVNWDGKPLLSKSISVI